MYEQFLCSHGEYCHLVSKVSAENRAVYEEEIIFSEIDVYMQNFKMSVELWIKDKFESNRPSPRSNKSGSCRSQKSNRSSVSKTSIASNVSFARIKEEQKRDEL